MYGISYYENRISQAKTKLIKLEEELEDLRTFKGKVLIAGASTMDQANNKKDIVNEILDLEQRLPLIKSIYHNLSSCFDEKLISDIEKRFEKIKSNVDESIMKTEADIIVQEGIIHNSQSAITVIREEERIEAARIEEERRREALEYEQSENRKTSGNKTMKTRVSY